MMASAMAALKRPSMTIQISDELMRTLVSRPEEMSDIQS